MTSCLFCGGLDHETENDYACSSCVQFLIGDLGYIEDFSPKAFRRAYVKALFLERANWITAIEKYQMIVAGSPKNARNKAKDTAEKERIRDQVSAQTYEDRKAFYKAWRDAPCCADNCDRYCDQCSNVGINL